ncbi:MAG: 4'-phosphopantetheinyl transferase superfamily protein [Ruminococcaceae bacterium]|nr:4'-phosphopantetheinyl transferase superfamily protein [Oscillospiraceae bacterium]
MTHLFLSDITPLCNDSFFEFAYKGLPEDKKGKVDKLIFRKDKNLSVGSQFVLVYALEKQGYDFSRLIIKKKKNGKPYVENENVYFSLSHSGNMVLCGVSDFPIGVDIQEMTDYNPPVAKRFFKQNEQRAISAAENSEDKKNMFFRIWTLKEAYAKMTGEGLGGFRNFEVVPEKGLLKSLSELGCRLFEFESDEYKIAASSKDWESDVQIHRVDIIECISMIAKSNP